MHPWQTELVVSLAISAFVVYRFVKRELGARVVRSRTLWIRPALLTAILGFLIFETVTAAPNAEGLLARAVGIGVIGGAVTGWLVVRSTTFSPAGERGAVRVHGSRVTAGVWIGAVLLRFVARLFVPHSGVGSQLALNAGLIALVAVAFIVVAFAFHRAIFQHAALAKTKPVNDFAGGPG